MTPNTHITALARKLSILLLSLCAIMLSSRAQTISVVGFRLDVTDLTAQNTDTRVFDQNGEVCALVRVLTTQKGFSFDVGSAGVQEIDDNHHGEIWVYIPYGTRYISISHPELGKLSNFIFPITIQKARTYILEITSDKVFINNYDDTRQQELLITTLPGARVTINGAMEAADTRGRLTKILSFGTYTYKIEKDGYFPVEGQVTISDPTQPAELRVTELRPKMGKLAILVTPYPATIKVDGSTLSVNPAVTPLELMVGEHNISVSAPGYRGESRKVTVRDDGTTTEVAIALTRQADFTIETDPTAATIYLDGSSLGLSPLRKTLISGEYNLRVTKRGFQDYEALTYFDGSKPKVSVKLKRILNYKNQLYFGLAADANIGSYVLPSVNLGCYISNLNLEFFYVPYLFAFDLGLAPSSGAVYWQEKIHYPGQIIAYQDSPRIAYYSITQVYGIRLGYGIPLGSKFRITPQVGANLIFLDEEREELLARTPNKASIVAGAKFSYSFAHHWTVFASPEYSITPVFTSSGYKELSRARPSSIGSWGEGLSVKAGINFYFNL